MDMNTARKSRYFWVPRLMAGIVGVILLTAALMKATDMEFFIRQMRDYGIIYRRDFLTLSAWGLIALECTLGAGLLVFYRPRLILSLTGTLLLIFIGATGWAWLTGSTNNCGCFGAWLKRTPEEALLENLILLSATILAWVGHQHSGATKSPAKARVVTIACLTGLMLPVAFGYPMWQFGQSQSDTVKMGLGQLQIKGLGNIDLGHGSYLITLIDTECLHCQEAVPEFNVLSETKDLPVVIGLCINEEQQRKSFVEEFQPVFPIGQIAEEDFWRLIGDGDIPRTIFLTDGRVRRVWDQKVPEKEEIKGEHNQ